MRCWPLLELADRLFTCQAVDERPNDRSGSNTIGNIVSQEKMPLIDPLGSTERQSDRVHRELEIVPQAQHCSSEKGGAQVILCMHFEKYRANSGTWAVYRDVGSEIRCLLLA